jgi:SP family facilitated glucose transporter-like MFS transporter 8
LPLYLGEIAQKEIRGILGTFMQLMVTLGILFVWTIGSHMSVLWLSGVCAILPLISGLAFAWMPETPTYLVNKNQISKAESSLKWLRGKNFDTEDEIENLKAEEQERQLLNQNHSLQKSFQRSGAKLSLIIVLGLMFFQQMCGINAVIFYTETIFEATATGISPSLQTILVGIIQVIMTIVSAILVDKIGRKPLLLLSAVFMIICHVAIGAYFIIIEHNPKVQYLNWLPLTAISVFIMAFSIGFGPIPFLVLGEVCAPDIKGFAVGSALTLNWTLSFIITKFFANLQDAIGIGSTFLLFSAFCVFGALFVLTFLPETKGISLSDIQVKLADGRTCSQCRKTVHSENEEKT